MDLEAFQALSTDEVARLVRADGPKVCAFLPNGTRRWFFLRHPELMAGEDHGTAYARAAGDRMTEIYAMLYDHGIDTLVVPVFGPAVMERGDEYSATGLCGLVALAQEPKFVEFYVRYDVRVHVYGDTHRYLAGTPYEDALLALNQLSRQTAVHSQRRLLYGVCAHDATEAVADMAVHFHAEHGRVPKREEIVAAYYGAQVEPVDFVIGSSEPWVFDLPLICTGREDLYFTVAPSVWLDIASLRGILYDHLYSRAPRDTDYGAVPVEEWEALRVFCEANRGRVIGVGRRSPGGHFWYPVPQVKVPWGGGTDAG